MPNFIVDIAVTGRVVVDAKSEDAAEVIAQTCVPTLAGKPIFDAEVGVTGVETMETFEPERGVDILQPHNGVLGHKSRIN